MKQALFIADCIFCAGAGTQTDIVSLNGTDTSLLEPICTTGIAEKPQASHTQRNGTYEHNKY